MLAGHDDIHKSLDEFEICPDPIRDHSVRCSLASNKSRLPLFLISQLCLYLGNSQVSVYRTIGPLVLYSLRRQNLKSDLVSSWLLYTLYLSLFIGAIVLSYDLDHVSRSSYHYIIIS